MTRLPLILSLALFGLTTFPVKAANPAKPGEEFVVHEWGTFSTFSGSDGIHLPFKPNDSDLPEFIYHQQNDRLTKGGHPPVLVSLETPVLYFYSERERTASVQVDFPEGVITEWYPQSTRTLDRRLQYDDIKLFPRGEKVPLTKETKETKSRYFAARETDASPIRVEANKGKTEQEKFVFYRGIGNFKMPFVVRAETEEEWFQNCKNPALVYVENRAKDPVPAFIVVQVQQGKIRFRVYGQLPANDKMGVRKRELEKDATVSELAEAAVKMLIGQGLYEKEARAMVKTWQGAWFTEEGSRVLYILPSAVTEKFLPLKVTPKPDRLVRVMVGRHDFTTREQEANLDRLIQVDREYHQMMERLGRYQWAAHGAASKRIAKQAETVKP